MNRLKCTIKLLVLGCLLTTAFNVGGQTKIVPNLKWANGFTGKGADCRDGILFEKGEMGNLISVGRSYRGTIDFDPGPANLDLSPGIQGIYIWKCDDDGQFLWVKTVQLDEGSPNGFPVLYASSLSVDQENGDIYISGIFGDSTIDFDPGVGITKMVPGNTLFGTYWPSLFILKLNASGDFQWVKQLDIYNGGGIGASAIAKHMRGENKLIYFAGNASPFMDYEIGENIPYDFDPGPDTAYIRFTGYNGPIGYILCLNDRGEFVWVKNIGDGGDALLNFIPGSMEINETHIFIGGLITGTADINPAPAVYNISGEGDLFLLKYTLNGDLVWARQSEMGKTVHEGVEKLSVGAMTAMELDTNGNIYISADFNGPVNFNKMMPYGGPATLINASYYPYLNGTTTTALLCYRNDGDFAWIKQIGGTDTLNRAFGSRLSLAKDGALYLSGVYNNTIDLNPAEDSFSLKGNSGYIAQYDTLGNFKWGGKILKGSPGSGHFVQTTHMKSEKEGVVYMAGYWGEGDMDVDPGSAGFLLTPADSAVCSGFVLKLTIETVDTTDTGDTATVVDNPLLSVAIKVYPNPTLGLLDFESSRILHNAEVNITSVAGAIVLQKKGLRGTNFQFDLAHLAPGAYIFELREGNHRRSYKLVKR